MTTSYIIAELTTLATSRGVISHQQILDFIERISSNPLIEIVHIDASLYQAALALLKARADKQWSLADAASFVVMQQRGITEALTLDKHFVQAGFVRLPKQE